MPTDRSGPASALKTPESPNRPAAAGQVVPFAEILGVRVSALGFEDMAHVVTRWAEGDAPPGAYVSATSVHGIVEATRAPEFAGILNRAALVAPDGMPLVWVGRVLGQPRMERVYGPSLMARICELSAGREIRHFFYGGRPGVADELARRLERRFPGLRVAGTHCPPFRPLTADERQEVAGLINGSGADLVWVGLSTPRQERWMAEMRGLLRARVLVSVGAAFDYHTGKIRSAPPVVQKAGLEWLYRLVQEPGRLWRRYAVNNPLFLWLVLFQLLGWRRPGSGSGWAT